nr:C-GCAxxG-C-C family (seleno)protein [uncultured Pseudodesulfovibrio sp.]
MADSIEKRVNALFSGDQFLCAETVVKMLAEAGGRDSKDIVPMATGLCSGMSRTCGPCGAVTGAVMGFGLYAGRQEPGADLDPVYAMIQEFRDVFSEKFKSINCFDLIGCDFSTQEGQDRYKRLGLRSTCVELVLFAVITSLSILREHGYLEPLEDLMASRLGPCGLMCGKCVAYAGGPVHELSRALKEQLGDNFGEYARRFEVVDPVFAQYQPFSELLECFASGPCSGCRESGCLFKACAVPACARKHGVSYCYECEKFPCEEHGMPERLAQIWRTNNERIRENGVEEYFNSIKDKPRYP